MACGGKVFICVEIVVLVYTKSAQSNFTTNNTNRTHTDTRQNKYCSQTSYRCVVPDDIRNSSTNAI